LFALNFAQRFFWPAAIFFRAVRLILYFFFPASNALPANFSKATIAWWRRSLSLSIFFFCLRKFERIWFVFMRGILRWNIRTGNGIFGEATDHMISLGGAEELDDRIAQNHLSGNANQASGIEWVNTSAPFVTNLPTHANLREKMSFLHVGIPPANRMSLQIASTHFSFLICPGVAVSFAHNIVPAAWKGTRSLQRSRLNG
jgi:hypothetical protein